MQARFKSELADVFKDSEFSHIFLSSLTIHFATVKLLNNAHITSEEFRRCSGLLDHYIDAMFTVTASLA